MIIENSQKVFNKVKNSAKMQVNVPCHSEQGLTVNSLVPSRCYNSLGIAIVECSTVHCMMWIKEEKGKPQTSCMYADLRDYYHSN